MPTSHNLTRSSRNLIKKYSLRKNNSPNNHSSLKTSDYFDAMTATTGLQDFEDTYGPKEPKPPVRNKSDTDRSYKVKMDTYKTNHHTWWLGLKRRYLEEQLSWFSEKGYNAALKEVKKDILPLVLKKREQDRAQARNATLKASQRALGTVAARNAATRALNRTEAGRTKKMEDEAERLAKIEVKNKMAKAKEETLKKAKAELEAREKELMSSARGQRRTARTK